MTSQRSELRLRGWAKLLSFPTATLLVRAAQGDSEGVQQALVDGADVNAQHLDFKHDTPLHFASRLAAPEMLFCVLDYHPLLQTNESGETPHHVAARYSPTTMALPLLVMSLGLPLGVDAEGNNVFHALMQNNRLAPAQLLHLAEWLLLYKDGASLLNSRNLSSMTVLDAAIVRSPPDAELHQLLLRHGARQGHALDLGDRDLLQHEERRNRSALLQTESDAAVVIIRWHSSRVQEISGWERFLRRILRLTEREEARRSVMMQEQSVQYTALLWLRDSEQASLKRMVLVMREDRSATLIQSRWRMFVSRRAFSLRRRESSLRTQAATNIQRVYRGCVARRQFVQLRTQMVAALAVQRLFRKVRSRRANRRCYEEERTRRTAAARTVQACWRRRIHEKSVLQRHHYALEANRQWIDDHIVHLDQVARQIQHFFKCVVVRNRFREHRRKVVLAQALWRRKEAIRKSALLVERRTATNIIMQALRRRAVVCKLRLHINDLMRARISSRVTKGSCLIARLLVQDQFVQALMDKRKPGSSTAEEEVVQPTTPTGRLDFIVNIITVALLCLMMLSMFLFPRGPSSTIANGIDIGAVALLWMRLAVVQWRVPLVFDFALQAVATTAIVMKWYQAVVVYVALLLRLPLLIGGTNQELMCYCRSMQHSASILVGLLPLMCAGLLAAARATVCEATIFDEDGNIGSALLALISANASHSVGDFTAGGGHLVAKTSHFTVPRWWAADDTVQNVTIIPLPQTIGSTLSIYVVFFSAFCVGVSTALKEYFESEQRGTDDRHRLVEYTAFPEVKMRRPESLEEVEATIETDWRVALRAAKDAIDASHDEQLNNAGMLPESHSRRHFIAHVHQSIHMRGRAASLFRQRASLPPSLVTTPRQGAPAEAAHDSAAAVLPHQVPSRAPSPLTCSKQPPSNELVRSHIVVPVGLQNETNASNSETDGDICAPLDARNEDVQARWSFDLRVLDCALGRKVRRDRWSAFWLRQLRGPPHRRETTLLVVAALVLSGFFPLNPITEGVSSGVFTLELLLLMKAVGMRTTFSTGSGTAFLLRIFCIIVGFVPQLHAVASLRALRLLEGWSHIFAFSNVHAVATLLSATLLGITYLLSTLSLLQGSSDVSLRDRTGGFCATRFDCFAQMALALVVPWHSPWHVVSTAGDHAVSSVLIIFFRFVLVPFVLCHLLHPIAEVSRFVNRFLFQTVKAMHHDLLNFIDNVTESSSWFTHHRLPLSIKPTIVTKLVLWVRRVRVRVARRREHPLANSVAVIFGSALSKLYTISRSRVAPPSMLDETSLGRIKEDGAMRENFPRVLRMPGMHVVHVLFTIASLAFLWGDPASPMVVGESRVARIAANAVHGCSILLSVVLVPRNASCHITVVSLLALITALSAPHSAALFSLRHVSHLRILQLQLGPLHHLVEATRELTLVSLRGLFFTLLALLASYTAFFIHSAAGTDANATNRSTSARESLERNFRSNASVLYQLYCYWLLPSIIIGSYFAYMRLTGIHLISTSANYVSQVSKLEDPIRGRKSWTTWVCLCVLDPTLTLFWCLFSATTTPEVMDLWVYWTADAVLTTAVLLLSFFRVISSAQRTRHRAPAPEPLRIDNVLLGCEVLGMAIVMWSLIATITVGLDGFSRTNSNLQYDAFLLLRFVLLLRYLPRLIKVALLHRWRYSAAALTSCAVVTIVVAAMDTEVRFGRIKGAARGHREYWESVRASAALFLQLASSAELPRCFAEALPVQCVPLRLMAAATLFKAYCALLLGVLIAAMLEKGCSAYVHTMPPGAAAVMKFVQQPENLQFVAFAGANSVAMSGSCGNARRLEAYKRQAATSPDVDVWMLPHIFEVLQIVNPARQRAEMWNLCQSIDFLRMMDRRRQSVKRFMQAWAEYRSGGPACMPFERIPCYPPTARPASSAEREDEELEPLMMAPTTFGYIIHSRRAEHVPALRVIQAVAARELNFPCTSSTEVRMWREFVLLQRKVRAAILMQSLWRMYIAVMEFEFGIDHTRGDVIAAQHLRASFRRLKMTQRFRFLTNSSMGTALSQSMTAKIFVPSPTHKIICDRLRNNYESLTPPEWRRTRSPRTYLRGGVGLDPSFLRTEPAFPPRYLQSNDLTNEVSEALRTSVSASSSSAASEDMQQEDQPGEPMMIGGNFSGGFVMRHEASLDGGPDISNASRTTCKYSERDSGPA